MRFWGCRPGAGEKLLSRLLRWSARSGNAAFAGWLITCGARVDASETEASLPPLLIAAMRRRAAVLRVLLRHGAGVNVRDRNGWTALMYAATRGALDCVHILLAAGADPDIRNEQGETALDLARSAPHPDVAAALESAMR